jgi:hypothetical protein
MKGVTPSGGPLSSGSGGGGVWSRSVPSCALRGSYGAAEHALLRSLRQFCGCACAELPCCLLRQVVWQSQHRGPELHICRPRHAWSSRAFVPCCCVWNT